jgi:hypothetical protein
MTSKQEKHLASMKQIVPKLMDKKYRKGQKEHKGNLWELSPRQLLYESIMESIDDLHYKLTLFAKLPVDKSFDRNNESANL